MRICRVSGSFPCVALVVWACFGAATGQSIDATANPTIVPVGGSVNFTLMNYTVGPGNSLQDIIGGYLPVGSSDIKPLASWNQASMSFVVYPNVASETPSFAGRVSVPSPRVMMVRNVSMADEALRFTFQLNYKDTVSRTKSSDPLQITVVDLHHVTVNTSSNLTGIEGQHRLTISCISSGVPTPSISWTKDGGPVPSSVQISFVTTAPNTNTSLLYFPILNATLRGVYTCHAENLAEKRSQSFTLAVKSAPGMVNVSSACVAEQLRVCWTSPYDTIDSKPELYRVSLSNGASASFPTAACVSDPFLANITAPYNVSIVAVNRHGVSRPLVKTITETNPCSASIVTAFSSSLSVTFLLGCALLHNFW